MQRSIVDLPEPEGPSTTTTSPGQTLRFTSFRTSVSSKLLLRCSMRTIGCLAGREVMAREALVVVVGDARRLVCRQRGRDVRWPRGDGA